MKAIACDRYGPPEALQVREIDTPEIEADRVLLRVRAASINPSDLHTVSGGIVLRVLSRSPRKPSEPVPGNDVAGVVEAVGENVTDYRPGDEVFGTCAGSLAELALGRKNLVPKPANISFEQAASVGIAGVTALQGLRDKGQLRTGQAVLINGAAGGVGTFAVQIAKAMGADVTGVCSGRNLEMVRSIGADHVIDYEREDFARSGRRFDCVLDLVGNRSLKALRSVVKPSGVIVLAGGGHQRGHGKGIVRALSLAGRGMLLRRLRAENIIFFIANINRDDLNVLREMLEASKITPVIDRLYPLSRTGEAMRHLQGGHAAGKVVITA